jgi:hypothetical protein
VEEHHLRPQTAEGLRQLAPDGPAADHGEPAGALGEPEHRLVGQKAGLGEPGDGGARRPGPGGDHRLREAKPGAVHLDGVRPHEAGRPEEHVDPEPSEALDGIVVTDPRPQAAHALHHRSEVGLDAPRHMDAERRRGADLPEDAGGADDALRGHTADVQAVAPQKVPLDQGHPGPEPRAPRRGDKTRRSRADHDEVVAGSGSGWPPVRGMDVVDKRRIVLVEGRKEGSHRPSLRCA